jgi:hypothetical protein
MATSVDRRLQELEAQVRAQIGGRFERYLQLDEPEKERIIKFLEHFLGADSGSFRDQAIRAFILDRLKFTYRYE